MRKHFSDCPFQGITAFHKKCKLLEDVINFKNFKAAFLKYCDAHCQTKCDSSERNSPLLLARGWRTGGIQELL